MSNATSPIATTILEQLGRPALAMIGAKGILAGDRHVQMKLGRNAKRVTHLTITLDPSDTYTLKFDRVPTTRQLCRGAEIRTLAEVDGVYFDQLRPTIERHTGLYTSL